MSNIKTLFDFNALFSTFEKTALKKWLPTLEQQLHWRFVENPHGDSPRWQCALDKLPPIDSETSFITEVALTTSKQTNKIELTETLQQLHPWRKGPFTVFDVHIDTEWHSDWKWDRVLAHLSPLKGRRVLDIGCGNGYHCWRMAGEGAKLVVGVDPSQLFFYQFQAIKKYTPDSAVFHIPLKLEDMPLKLNCFDTVFSMGVLYHRKSPLEHIEQLKSKLKSKGELVLETLIVDGDEHTVLMPEGRYAQMNNVYFLPSTCMLEKWLAKMGFINIRTVDVNTTSVEEQRPTEWMKWQSLPHFLNPDDHSLTIEGYPAPKRAVLIAQKP